MEAPPHNSQDPEDLLWQYLRQTLLDISMLKPKGQSKAEEGTSTLLGSWF